MAISYKAIKLPKPGQSGSSKEYERSKVVSNGTITANEFYKMFSATTNFSEADVVYLMHSLKAFILKEIKAGNIVQMGVLGTFYPEIKLRKRRSKDKTIVNNLTAVIHFRSSAILKKEIEAAEVKRVK